MRKGEFALFCISKWNKDCIASGSAEETMEDLGSVCGGFQGNSAAPVVLSKVHAVNSVGSKMQRQNSSNALSCY